MITSLSIVESWVTIVDLSKTSVTMFSKEELQSFIDVLSNFYFSRNRVTFVLNTGPLIKMLYSAMRIFLSTEVQQKVNMASSNTDSKLLSMVHPEQLQEQYGGNAPNVRRYWPPYVQSNKYGVK